jgi:predicted AAA+ superfamily ATPase
MDPSSIMDILADWNYWGNYDRTLLDRMGYLERMRDLFSRRTALFVSGIRRAGKSSLSEILLKDMILKGELEKKDTLFINFEDPRFPAIMSSDDVFKVYETYISRLRPNDPVIVLDEVQKVEGWERFARYLLESRNQRLIVTGSSSKMLDHEISDVLTGRHVDIEVTPLSFFEYLTFNNIDFSGIGSSKNRMEIEGAFLRYRVWGGFPEVVLAENDARRSSLLKSYYDDIVSKDIVKRYHISEVAKLESLLDLYVTNIASIQSYNKLKDRVSISADTVQRYTEYIIGARMLFVLDKFDWSRWEQIKSRKKVYVSDIGFYTIKGFRFSENRSKVLENLVAIELMRGRDPSVRVFYWRDYQDHEVDFVLVKGDRITDLIQVSAISGIDEIASREIRSLTKASKETKCENLTVVTEDLELERDYHGMKIRFVPIKKWLMGQ